MAAFCQSCGGQLHTNSKFCHNCGKKIVSNASSSSTISYEEFKKRKEVVRQSHFQRTEKNAKKKTTGKEMAKVQVGVMALDQETTHLKRVNGRSMPIQISTDCDVTTILKTAVEKQDRYFKQFNGFLDYVLLYPDKSIVKYLPGGTTPFTLAKYKEDLLKPYSKMMFYLCEKKDYEDHNDHSSGSDLETSAIFTDSSELSTATPASKTSQSVPKTSQSVPKTSQSVPKTSQSSTYTGVICVEDNATTEPMCNASFQCPTCLHYFTFDQIEQHADLCLDVWLDPIGHCEQENIEEPEEPMESENEDKVDTSDSATDTLESIKAAVLSIRSIYASSHTNIINVRRASVFKDYIAARKKRWFKQKGQLKITFLGEPAVDDGGPRREFFAGVFGYIKCTYFNDDGTPYADMRALANEEFKAVGELMAYSILQGGPAPCFFSVPVYLYIVNGMSSIDPEIWLSQVRDDTLKEHINQIKACNSNTELQQLLSKDSMLSILQSTGYRGIPSRETVDSAEDIIRSLVLTGITKTLTVIDQLVLGLQSFSFLLEYVKGNHKLMQPIFCVEGNTVFKPTFDLLLSALKPEFSADGSNLKAKQVDVYKNFCDYVQDLESREGGVSKLYQFITGSPTFTPLALEKNIVVYFKYGCPTGCKCRPTASTCEPCINLPMHYTDEVQFSECMDSALAEGVGFGLI